jgi:outer membrane receptor protein involved in Fe transport
LFARARVILTEESMRFQIFRALLIVALIAVPSMALATAYGGIKGTVADSNGNPVAGATVQITAPDERPQTTKTDAHGDFNFPLVPFDTYTITATTSNYAPVSDVVTVASGSVESISLKFTTKVLGHVTITGAAMQKASQNVVTSTAVATLPANTSLNKIVETVPGVVPFSYNEPVARGYHGITYEIDGVPMPQTTTAEFSEIIDPRDVDRVEVLTGSIPAEFGGDRMGAVVDIASRRPSAELGDQALFSEYGGTYATAGGTFDEFVNSDHMSMIFTTNSDRNSRGLDSPTFDPDHDNSNQSDEFLRLADAPDSRDTISVDFVNQFSGFEIPIDTNQNDPDDPQWSLPGTDDNQYEYYRSANIVFNRATADGLGYFEISPWYRSNRIVYTPDPGLDLLSQVGASTSQNRLGQYLGLTGSYYRSADKNDFKVGFTTDAENFTGQFEVQAVGISPFFDDSAKRGTELGLYAEDQYAASNQIQINYGVRYDRSTGYVDGNQLEPRIEVDDKVNPNDTFHVYFGRTYAAPSLEDVRRAAVILGASPAPSPSATPPLPVYDLKPETDSIYEVGEAHRFSDETTGSVTFWGRNVWNVLDTTQLGDTPLFTVYNSGQGQAEGMELRLQGRDGIANSWFLSYGLSQSLANGISGGTFLFSPADLQGAVGWALEDHDQTDTVDSAYTWVYREDGRGFTTFETLYGNGFPVQFENGPSRLPPHVTFNGDIGLRPPPSGGGFGWELQGTNLLNKMYLLKFSNGFNTTQWAAGRQVTFTLSEAFR